MKRSLRCFCGKWGKNLVVEKVAVCSDGRSCFGKEEEMKKNTALGFVLGVIVGILVDCFITMAVSNVREVVLYEKEDLPNVIRVQEFGVDSIFVYDFGEVSVPDIDGVTMTKTLFISLSDWMDKIESESLRALRTVEINTLVEIYDN